MFQWSNSSSYLLSGMLLLTSTAVCPAMLSVSIVAISLASHVHVRFTFGMLLECCSYHVLVGLACSSNNRPGEGKKGIKNFSTVVSE